MAKSERMASPLRLLREALGYSRPQFAKRLGTTEHNLEKIERGGGPGRALAKRILLQYGFDLERIDKMAGTPRPVIPSKKPLLEDALNQWQWGPGFFSINDFLDLDGLVEELRVHTNPLARFLWNRFSAGARRTLKAQSANKDLCQKILRKELNKLIKDTSIYDETLFADVDISPKTRKLQVQNPKGKGLVLLNRSVLEDAYPLYIRHGYSYGKMIQRDAYLAFEALIGPKVEVALAAARRESKSFAFVDLLDEAVEKIVKDLDLKGSIDSELRQKRADRQLINTIVPTLETAEIKLARKQLFEAERVLRETEEKRLKKVAKALHLEHATVVELARRKGERQPLDWRGVFDFQREGHNISILLGVPKIMVRLLRNESVKGKKSSTSSKQRLIAPERLTHTQKQRNLRCRKKNSD